jgi:hypothetical protein
MKKKKKTKAEKIKELAQIHVSSKYNASRFKLCYIDKRHNLAYFTTTPITVDLSDNDWHKRSYEHNVGSPPRIRETKMKGEVLEVCFICESISQLKTPAQLASDRGASSELSVNDINLNKRAPWLESQYGTKIWAGTTLPEFLYVLKCAHAQVYFPNTIYNKEFDSE